MMRSAHRGTRARRRTIEVVGYQRSEHGAHARQGALGQAAPGQPEAEETGVRCRPPRERIAVVTADARLSATLKRSLSGSAAFLSSPQALARVLDATGAALTWVVDASVPWLSEPLLSLARQASEDALLVWRVPSPAPLRVFARHEAEACASFARRWIAEPHDPASRILGVSPHAQRVREQIRKIAEYRDVSVLVLGETGTGKELVACAIHQLTQRGDGPELVGVNCAALPEPLVESELFGHEAGAFTGARGARAGLLETAGRGTVFLDEIGEMPDGPQAKLLRVLETRWFRRVGSNRDLPLEARVVSATHRSPRRLKRSGLRPDLYYRLASFTIELAPLRERLEDVSILARHFLDGFAGLHRLPPIELTRGALAELESHSWPGNARELRAVMEQAAILCRDATIDADLVRDALGARAPLTFSSIPPAGSPERRASIPPLPAPEGGLRDVEREIILRAFEECAGNVSSVARRLRLPRSTVRGKLRRLGLL